jgi:TRAP-type mannitol/chloroaromatic compound transport system substrate-binding protein
LRLLILSLLTGVVIGILLTINSRGSYDQNSDPVSRNNWKLVSSFQPDNGFIGKIGTEVSNKINLVEKRKFFVKLYGPNTLVPNSQLFNAVRSGSVEFALTTSKIWKNKSSAFELFNGYPFGPNVLTLLSWFYDNEGKEIY